MGDMGDIFNAMRDLKKERKAQRLEKANPEGWLQHTEYHWSRMLNGKKLNYWPSTGKFEYNNIIKHGDVMKFIEKVCNNA